MRCPVVTVRLSPLQRLGAAYTSTTSQGISGNFTQARGTDMKRLLVILSLLLGILKCPAPIKDNSFTTNSPGKTPTLLPTNSSTNLLFVMHISGDGTILQGPVSLYVSNNVVYGDGSGLTNGIWMTNSGFVQLVDTNLGVWIGDPGRSLHLQSDDVSMVSKSGVGLCDWYAYERAVNDNVALFEFGLDGNYGDTVAMDPANDNGFPQPFLFSTTTTNVIAAGSVLYAIANAHTNVVEVFGNGGITGNGTHYFTNTWAGPTNTVDLLTYDQNYASFTACSVTGFANKLSDRTSEILLSIKNLSASNFVMTLQAGIVDGDFVSSHTITNGTTGVFWFRYTPQGPRTNCVFRQL